MDYATKGQMAEAVVDSADMTVGGLAYKLAPLTREDIREIRDEIGTVINEVTGEDDCADPEELSLFMLAASLIAPPFDWKDADDVTLLREMPIGITAKLSTKMLDLSGLGKEDPT